MSYKTNITIKGTTYVYEVDAYWDKEKKQSRAKRVCIGKLDPNTGEFIPNKKNAKVIATKHYGNYYLLDNITENIGLKQVLMEVFPKEYEQILACAFHQVCTRDPLSNCEQWTGITYTSMNKVLPNQRISDLLTKITFEDRILFFKKWAKHREEQEYIAFDITSISSYSKLIEMVEYGYNRDRENLPQINLGMLFGETSQLPIFYNSYPGSIRDVSTLDNLLKTAKTLGIDKIRLVMDKGFYSQDNIDELLKRYFKFTIGLPFTTKLTINAITEARDTITSARNSILVGNDVIGAYTISQKWGNTNRNMFIHVYYNKKHNLLDEETLMRKVLILEEEIKTGNKLESNKHLYDKYFKVRKVNQSTTEIIRKEDVINEELKTKGYFITISNDIKDAKTAMEIYRRKDVVEKAFNNMKNELDMDRLHVHSEKSLQGKLYLIFIATIILSAIQKVMNETGLNKKYTKRELLSEMSKLSVLEFSDKSTMLTEISKEQIKILEAFNIKTPTN